MSELSPHVNPLNPQALFQKIFWPLYPLELRTERTTLRSVPPPCDSPQSLRLINDVADVFKRLAPSMLGLPEGCMDDSDASVHRLGAALTRTRRDALIRERSIDRTRVPLLGQLTIHGTLYVGRCIVRNHQGIWRVRHPLWESTVLLESALGQGELNVFQWWLKSLSDDEIDRMPLGDRYRSHVEIPCFDGWTMPVIAPEPSSIPRLLDTRHEQIERHLRSHAPQIQALGNDFPSQERIAQLGFSWLDFVWIGDGRMLLVHGPTQQHGAHFIWMDQNGFVKSLFYPSDNFPNHRLRFGHPPMIQLILSIQNVTTMHEMPWWGL